MKRILLIVAIVVGIAVWAHQSQAADIGFIEDFALAPDRSVPLKQLVPGTENYYYYHCLHYQNTGDLDRADAMLKTWIGRYTNTSLIREIQNRQALLRYETAPRASLDFLKGRLGLLFNHRREIAGQKPTLPIELKGELISQGTLTARALSRYSGTLRGFEDRALDWLIKTNMERRRRRRLLSRLTRPDYANLPKLVVGDLNERDSRGFGSHKIHAKLLLAQLEECLKLKGDLLNNRNFVNAYMAKLAPDDDVDAKHDAAERKAYLERMWAFLNRLSPTFNSLKANVLYHRLVHDRALGIYDKGRFMTYIKLPRDMVYVNRKYLNRRENRRYQVNLRSDYRRVTTLPPIRTDEALVRSYLQKFFVREDTTTPYEPYLDKTWLKGVFAEAKIVNGLGDMEKWYSMLPPAKHQALKERVDIDFAHTNKTMFASDENVKLDLYVKNVETLIVKVYEINTMNYYAAEGREVDLGINLDGLVANREHVERYKEPPLLRKRRAFTFPELKKPGVYVIEFIGSDKRSRALVRKGTLRFLTRTSTAGHVFTILDEQNRKLGDVSLWLSGHQYMPGEDDTITVPYTEKPGRQSIILQHGNFASLGHFDHASEKYALKAGIYVDREALLKWQKASVIVRPVLALNGTPVTLSVLEDVRLIITSVDREGISAVKEVSDFKLFEDRESTYEFSVPDRLASISFAVRAKVHNLSKNKDENLYAGETFTLNGIDKTEKVEDLHLNHIDGKYVLEVLGKTGEPKLDRPVHFRFKHRDFKEIVNVSLQTDGELGRIRLGALADIEWVRARGPEGTEHFWYLLRDFHSYPSTVHGRAGDPIYLPYMGSRKQPVRAELSLLAKRGGTFMADRFDALKLKDGFIVIDDLPRGNYELYLKDTDRTISIRLAPGRKGEGYVLSENRQLEVLNPTPLQIERIDVAANEVKIRLKNADKFARVHVTATRFVPQYHIAQHLGSVGFPGPGMMRLAKTESLYQAGRKLGDEYRYILERKYARKFPGNMLGRPGLLLNPWALSKTRTSRKGVAPGEGLWGEAGGGGDHLAGKAWGGYISKLRDAREAGSNLDFLGSSTVLLTNLRPDKTGVVTIKRSDLGAHQQIHVVAIDPTNTVYREVSLPAVPMKYRNLWLVDGLDPAKHFTEQKKITIVKGKQTFVLEDVTTSKFEVYDTLSKVYALYVTLSDDATLREFNWILDWPKMKPEAKREKYSKYACHELNFFLYRKDPRFFTEAVKPYIANKKDKTFLDRWLLGNEGKNDLAEYLEPWNFAQLNVVERILLARHIKGEPTHTARYVRDIYDTIPPNIERFNHLFMTALKGSALEVSDPETTAAIMVPPRPAPSREAGMLEKSITRMSAQAKPSGRKTKGRAYKKAKSEERLKLQKAVDELEFKKAGGKEIARYDRDKARRRDVRRFYRKLEKTEELVENNYYHLPISETNANLVKVNAFWDACAQHDGTSPFFSEHLAEASGNFTEMMFALSMLDIPFEAPKHKSEIKDARFKLDAAGPMVIFHKEIKEAQLFPKKPMILVSQNFFKRSDRYTHVNNERFDKYVTDEFIVHTVYGCHVVITNPTSSRQKLDVLLQVPRGAIPVLNGHYTRGVHMDLQPYHTRTFEYHFYFPAPGECAHYPVHVAKNEKLSGFAKPVALNVVAKPSKVDTASWDYISQRGSAEEVINYLKRRNLNRIKLTRIAWRMSDRNYFRKVTQLLTQRHVYDQTLWSYGIRHNNVATASEYLKHRDRFLRQCGDYIDTKLLKIDPVVRKSYQHMEYEPLVNARAHKLSKRRAILNNRFSAQYHRLMKVLSYRAKLDDDDLMAVTYYLLLQDRVSDALDFFARVNPGKLGTTLQHDYFRAYLDFYTDDHKIARAVAKKYENYPVDRWRKRFVNVISQLNEIEGKGPAVADDKDRTQLQTRLAATEPSMEFKVEAKKITINYQNLTECVVSYYLMDVELLFSNNPFVRQSSGQFAYIRPNETARVKLPTGKTAYSFAVPKKYHSSNVMVEIVAGPIRKSQAYYAHELALQIIENYGQLRVTSQKTGRPLPKVYVKVYARTGDGSVKFYKDGYTDLRGRFDYTSLSTNELDRVERFSLLVMSKTAGAVVREASPPKR